MLDILDTTAQKLYDEFPYELEKVKAKFMLVGSRAIFPREQLTPETDYDFVGESTQENIAWINSQAFYDKNIICSGYMDDATTHVFQHMNGMIQVTLKSSEYWNAVNRMWVIFLQNPTLFKKYFWKSYQPTKDFYPTSQNQVRERINLLLQIIRT